MLDFYMFLKHAKLKNISESNKVFNVVKEMIFLIIFSMCEIHWHTTALSLQKKDK